MGVVRIEAHELYDLDINHALCIRIIQGICLQWLICSESFAYYLTEDHSRIDALGTREMWSHGGWRVARWWDCRKDLHMHWVEWWEDPPNPIKCPDSRNFCKQGLKSRSLVVFCYLLICFWLRPAVCSGQEGHEKSLSPLHLFTPPIWPSPSQWAIPPGKPIQSLWTQSSGLTCFGVWGSFPSFLLCWWLLKMKIILLIT